MHHRLTECTWNSPIEKENRFNFTCWQGFTINGKATSANEENYKKAYRRKLIYVFGELVRALWLSSLSTLHILSSHLKINRGFCSPLEELISLDYFNHVPDNPVGPIHCPECIKNPKYNSSHSNCSVVSVSPVPAIFKAALLHTVYIFNFLYNIPYLEGM